MSRRLRSILPTTHQHLKPKVVDSKEIQNKLSNSRLIQKQNYDKTAKPLKPLKTGQSIRVQMKGKWLPAVILEKHENRSYSVQTQNGGIYRRNRRFLLPTNEKLDITDNMPNIVLQPETADQSDFNITTNSPISPEQPLNENNQQTINQNKSIVQPYVTRYGRLVKPNVLFSSDNWEK